MDKFWLILREVDKQLVEHPPLTSKAEALVVTQRVAIQDISSRYVVLEAVAHTSEPKVEVGIDNL